MGLVLAELMRRAVLPALAWAVVGAATTLALGCSAAEDAPRVRRSAGEEGTRAVSSDGRGAFTALADTVRFGGVLYEASFYGGEGLGRHLAEGDLGAKHGEVRYRLATHDDPGHEPADGDAAYLRPGTPVYEVEGYEPSFWLAARQRGELTLYEAVSNPRAEEGSDLLDVDGKVRRIDVAHREDAGEVLGTIDAPEEVGSLVRGLLGASLQQTDPDHFGTKDTYLVIFRLRDGMVAVREYRTDTGRLAPGIVAPEGFRRAIEGALEGFLEEQEELREATAAEELRAARACGEIRTTDETRTIDRGVPYTTNDVPGGPFGGVLGGTEGGDRLAGEDGEDEVYGLGGDDTAEGGLCDDEVWGGPGDDHLMGGGAMDPEEEGDDVLRGGPGADQLNGDLGDDVIHGDEGNDFVLHGGGGEDAIYGGEGDDLLDAARDGQRDEIYCGGGRDSYAADEIDVVADDCEVKTRMMVSGSE